MKKEVKERLINEYDGLKYRERYTALKYCFRYNGVYVNIFFDNYDKNVPSMSLILAYNNKYYYTSLNIKNTAIRTEYFRKIPLNILERLLDENNHLDGFFESIETHILNSKKSVVNYESDICFANTIRYSRYENDLPFLYSLRKTRMLNDTLEQLSEIMGIDRLVLRKIQSEGFTIVRTDDVNKRKSLKAIIGNLDIFIE